MLGSGKTRAVRALVTASPARSRDADPYRQYAVGLYRQALLTRGDSALAEPVGSAVLVNEGALARSRSGGDDDARDRWTRAGPGALQAGSKPVAASAARCLLRDEGHQCRGPLSRSR